MIVQKIEEALGGLAVRCVALHLHNGDDVEVFRDPATAQWQAVYWTSSTALDTVASSPEEAIRRVVAKARHCGVIRQGEAENR